VSKGGTTPKERRASRGRSGVGGGKGHSIAPTTGEGRPVKREDHPRKSGDVSFWRKDQKKQRPRGAVGAVEHKIGYPRGAKSTHKRVMHKGHKKLGIGGKDSISTGTMSQRPGAYPGKYREEIGGDGNQRTRTW